MSEPRRCRRAGVTAAAVVLGAGLLVSGCAAFGPDPAGGSGGGVATSRAAGASPDAVLLDTLAEMGRTSEARHRYGKAVEQYRKLVDADPDNVDYLLGLARNLRYAGQPQEAVSVLRRALAEERVAPGLDIRLELARALVASGITRDARARVAALETRHPNDPRVQSLVGILADREGQHRAAQAAYRSALAGRPGDLRISNNLALSLALSGDLGEAIALQERTAAAADATLQMRQNLALLYALAGRMDEARRVVHAILPKAHAERVVADLGRLVGRPAAVPRPDVEGGAGSAGPTPTPTRSRRPGDA